jgi:hypothetical protein
MVKWQPKDVVSLVLIIGSITMICIGVDSFIKWTLLAVVGAYYGIDLTPFIKLGRIQKKREED